jgi:anhydrotetracycline 6-monooxygenase / 5a,11a-dehydrotetracycline 5-monooxygenase
VDAQVIVVGAGPVGLMLASELRLYGISTVVLERLEEPTGWSKAFGLHARSIETVELRGLVQGMTEHGMAMARRMFGQFAPGGSGGKGAAGRPAGDPKIRLAHFAGIRTLRIDRLDTNQAELMTTPQAAMEEYLGELATSRGAEVRRGQAVTAVEQDAGGVTVTVDGGERLRAAYLVGCDGGHSTVRGLAGFDFPGTAATITCRLGDIAVPELYEDFGGWHRTGGGVVQVTPGRVLTVEFDGPPDDRDAPMTVEELTASIRRVTGRDVTLSGTPSWMSRFGDATRHATEYRRGRVLLAGDAAHVHSPFGGQGLNLGIQDAVNLGWKLAAELAGWAPTGLLDTYRAERHPVAARVLHNTRAQVALMNPDPRITPLREVFTELMELDQTNRHLAEMITALEVRYDLPGDSPLTGRFVPHLPIKTDTGETTARALCHTGRPVLLDLTGGTRLASVAAGWSDRVDLVSAVATGPAVGLGGIGTPGGAPLPDALLIRPDGYLAWASTDAETDPRPALTASFGRPA